jgi:hypothetical protein
MDLIIKYFTQIIYCRSATHPVIDNTNATSSSDNPSSTHRNDQESRRSSKSPIEHHSRHSDRRSR